MDNEWLGFYFPDELTMFELLGVVRLESEEGFWEYEITDQYQITLRLSFNFIEKYFQTVLSANGRVLQSANQDGVWTLHTLISGGTTALRAEAHYDGSFTTVDIFWKPNIRVSWRSALTAVY